MNKPFPPVQYKKITHENASALAYITSFSEDLLKASVGWFLIEDWAYSPRFMIIHWTEFRHQYPDLYAEWEQEGAKVLTALSHKIAQKV